MNAASRKSTPAQTTARDPRWGSIVARDRAADGQFYYSVRSTGVYCRPSCAAPRPRPENVAFHDDRSAAEGAGFRPCRRCKPDRADAIDQTAAARATIRFAIGACGLGSILVAASERGLRAILLGDDPAALEGDLRQRIPHGRVVPAEPAFAHTVARAIDFVDARTAALDLMLDVQGTPFQLKVWAALRGIPGGTTTTYADVAARIGAPRAARAVAQACAANPLAVAIPCHRVVRSGGALSGYRWGVERKRALLAREART